MATPKPRAQIFCPKKQARIFFFIPLPWKNEAAGKTLPKTAEKMVSFL
jgi:hypothetical protein